MSEESSKLLNTNSAQADAEIPAKNPRVVVQTADFSVDEVYQKLLVEHAPNVGAVVTFVGLVRDQNPGHYARSSNNKNLSDSNPGSSDKSSEDTSSVASLTLEHYPGMTERSIEKILADADVRWPLLGSHVIHRVGTMQPSEQIVLVAVASAHRDAAFAAAEFIMDYLKTGAVFWKKEVTGQGEHWIKSTDNDQQRAAAWARGAGSIDKSGGSLLKNKE